MKNADGYNWVRPRRTRGRISHDIHVKNVDGYNLMRPLNGALDAKTKNAFWKMDERDQQESYATTRELVGRLNMKCVCSGVVQG